MKGTKHRYAEEALQRENKYEQPEDEKSLASGKACPIRSRPRNWGDRLTQISRQVQREFILGGIRREEMKTFGKGGRSSPTRIVVTVLIGVGTKKKITQPEKQREQRN